MKTNRILILLSLLLLVIASCSDNEPSNKIDTLEKSTKRTVLIYMAAANSLGGLGSNRFDISDLNEMRTGLKSVAEKDLDNANVLVYYEGGRGDFYVDKNDSLVATGNIRMRPKLYRLVKNPKNGKGEFFEIKDYPIQSSTDPEVMKKVLIDAYSAYPSASYGLVMWSHADGWLEGTPGASSRWIGEDIYDGVSHKMDILDFKKALSGAPYLDFIFYDLCLMQTAEVAYELKDEATYSLGSPAEIPGPGSPYDKMIPIYFQTNRWIVNDLANAYYSYYAKTYTGTSFGNNPWRGGVSISIFDLSSMRRFGDATLRLLEQREVPYTDLVSSSDVFFYDPRRDGKYYYTDVIDVLKKSGVAQSPDWTAAFNRLVTYYKTTDTNYSGVTGKDFSMKGSNGISMYIPRKSDRYYTENEYYKKLAWAKLMMGY